MRIAVSYDQGNIFGSFGQTEKFKIYNIEKNQVIDTAFVETEGAKYGQIVYLLHEWNVQVVITGHIGPKTIAKLDNLQIEYYGGVIGDCDKAVENYIHDTLNFKTNTFMKKK